MFLVPVLIFSEPGFLFSHQSIIIHDREQFSNNIFRYGVILCSHWCIFAISKQRYYSQFLIPNSKMEETIRTVYVSELRTEATHVRSGKTLITDAPVDNKGRGEAFSPTDLLATSLGSCMLTIMGIAAREHNFDIDNTTIKIWKIMASDPRRVGEVKIELTFPKKNYSVKEKKIIERSAYTCPVYLSLHPDLIKTMTFIF